MHGIILNRTNNVIIKNNFKLVSTNIIYKNETNKTFVHNIFIFWFNNYDINKNNFNSPKKIIIYILIIDR